MHWTRWLELPLPFGHVFLGKNLIYALDSLGAIEYCHEMVVAYDVGLGLGVNKRVVGTIQVGPPLINFQMTPSSMLSTLLWDGWRGFLSCCMITR